MCRDAGLLGGLHVDAASQIGSVRRGSPAQTSQRAAALPRPPPQPPRRSRRARPRTAVQPPAAGPQPARRRSSRPDAKPPETRKHEANPADAKPTAAPAVQPDRPIPTPPCSVEITADEAVWVLARADGKYAFSGTMDANTTRTVEASEGSDATAGQCRRRDDFTERQAGWSGRPQGPGANGSVTSGGFQIVPAKPPSAPPDAADRL